MNDSVVVQVISINVLNLFMLAMLNIAYFLKPRINQVEHTIFGRMLLLSLVGSISGLLFGLFTSIIPIINLFTIFLEKTYNILIIDWILLLSFYTYIISTTRPHNNELIVNNLKKFFIASGLLYFVPVNIELINSKIIVTGTLLDLTYIISAIVMAINLILVLKNIKHIREKKYIPIYSMLILSIAFIAIQAANSDFNYLNSLLGMIIGYLMYFTIENPDVKMVEELMKAQKLSEQTSNEKGNFIYTVSEDIENRLSNADKVYENVMSLDPDNEIKEYMYDLKDIISGARNMLRKTIDISDMDNKHLQITNNKYNVKLLLESVYTLKKQELKPNVDFRLNISDDLPAELYGDSIKLKQIITTVLDNSINYTEKGFIELRVNSIIKNEICRLIISVEDSGKGIDIYKQNEIMNNSSDLTKEEISSLDNMNLNLKTIRKMISVIGGTFTIDNNKYNGTTISITLDQKVYTKEKSKEEENIEKYSEALKNQKTCAIITLDKNTSKTIKNIAKKKFKVEEFNITKNCLDNVRNGINYDIILIDEKMEKIDARSLLSKLKDEEFKGKVIIITKNRDIKLKKELLELGFDSIVYLPIDKKELNNKLSNI